MDNTRALVNFAILNANRRSGKNYLDSLVPFVEELFIRMKFEEVNIDRICQDFASEFSFKIPIHPMKVVLKRLVKLGKIKYCDNNVWKNIKTDDSTVITTRQKYERNYNQILQSFISFIKIQFHEDINEEVANNTLIAFLEKQDANLLFFAKKNLMLFPEVHFEKKIIRQLAIFLKNEVDLKTDNFDYLVEIASGHILASTIVNEKKEVTEEKVQKVAIYCDTSHILSLLGLAGDIPQKMIEDLFSVFIKSKCQIKLFKHTYDEIIHNINNAKKWFNSPVCDMEKASKTLLYFVKNNLTSLDIDRILNSIDSSLSKFNITIEDTRYEDANNKGQIDEKRLREYIISEYKKSNEEFDETNSSFLLDNDVRSISMVYRKLEGKYPQRFKDLKTVFICTNSRLVEACRTYHFENEEPEQSNFIPICVTDTFLGTYMWLQSPLEIDSLAKRKLISEVYSILQPTDSMIRKYLTEVYQSYKRKEISESDYLLLRATSVIEEFLPEQFDNAESITDKTPSDILDKLKSQSKEEGLRKYYEERDEHRKAQEKIRITEEKRDSLKKEKQIKIFQIISKCFDTIMVFLIFILIFLGSVNILSSYLKWIVLFLVSVLGVVGFLGFACGQPCYEELKRKIISPIVNKIYEKLWGDL